jgi:hypothetical protein
VLLVVDSFMSCPKLTVVVLCCFAVQDLSLGHVYTASCVALSLSCQHDGFSEHYCCCHVLLLCCSTVQDLSLGQLDCTPDIIFQPTTYRLQDLTDVLPGQVLDLARLAASQVAPGLLAPLVGLQVVMKPIAVHAMVLAVFASLVAPFGECGPGVG